ncbi:hypothetical protein C8Q74DRAFT_1317919 [Fomes fomentarius]|nr:hypothetical protein C8Q74DRAFT_1317919 [Fomes fomentarius]
MDSLTCWQRWHEDRGYILQRNALFMKAMIARLWMRWAHTIFHWVEGHNGHIGNEAADALVAIGAEKDEEDMIDLDVPLAYTVSGAKLSVMMQKLTYRVIHQQKDAKTEKQPRMEFHMKMLISGAADVFGVNLQEAAVWKSLQGQHVSKPIGQFIMHWEQGKMTNEQNQNTVCKACVGTTETMTHIIFDCNAIRRELIWDLLEEVWKTEDGARRSALEKLWCILCTEVMHLIWKLHCERVIWNDGAEFTENEVTNRLHTTINAWLTLDRRTAALAKGKKALSPDEVAQIWMPVLENKTKLPLGWVVDNGVLVGIKRGC